MYFIESVVINVLVTFFQVLNVNLSETCWSSSNRFCSTQWKQTLSRINPSKNCSSADTTFLGKYEHNCDVMTITVHSQILIQNWIDFFSAIGGLLGLCIGLSIVTFVELFWLGFRIICNLFRSN